MPITRSTMSGATKKVEKLPDGPKQKSRPKQKSGLHPRTIKMKDYVKRYYETHPFPASGFATDPNIVGIKVFCQWRPQKVDTKNGRT
ncbi:hypothetical protein OROMI_005294 [Orobanche minor]